VGISEAGRPCPRRLAYGIAGLPPARLGGQTASWYATVGTAVHALLEQAFGTHGGNTEGGRPRYLTEQRVDCGDGVVGTLDLYDRVEHTIVDFKTAGRSTLDKVRRHGPSDTHRTQVQLYGYGAERAGLPVKRVSLLYVPRNGLLEDSQEWSEDYDSRVAEAAIERIRGIRWLVKKHAFDAPLKVRAESDRCGECPWFDPRARPNGAMCPGVNIKQDGDMT
jgi:PD-(D/E)XK nuclease superfamily